MRFAGGKKVSVHHGTMYLATVTFTDPVTSTALAGAGATAESATRAVFRALHKYVFDAPISPHISNNWHDYDSAESFQEACERGYDGYERQGIAVLLWDGLATVLLWDELQEAAGTLCVTRARSRSC